MFCQKTDCALLAVRKFIIPLAVFAILPLAGIARDHKHRSIRVRLRHIRFRDFRHIRREEREFKHQPNHMGMVSIRLFRDIIQIFFLCLLKTRVISVKPHL